MIFVCGLLPRCLWIVQTIDVAHSSSMLSTSRRASYKGARIRENDFIISIAGICSVSFSHNASLVVFILIGIAAGIWIAAEAIFCARHVWIHAGKYFYVIGYIV
jgi:hypothetical protein